MPLLKSMLLIKEIDIKMVEFRLEVIWTVQDKIQTAKKIRRVNKR